MTHTQLGTLAKKAENGDVGAFAALYNHFSERVYFFALRLTKNEEDANDVVQDTMLKLYSNLHKLRNPQAVTRFVNQITYNSAMDTIKQRQNLLLTEEDDILDPNSFAEDEFAPASRLEKEEKSKQIISAIDMLNDNLRSVIILYYYQQLSVKEISETIDVNENAVKMRLSRGRQELKKILSSNGFKGVVTMSVVLSLTRVLQTEAKAACTGRLLQANWERLGKSLDFSPKTIQKHASVATQSTKIPTNESKFSARPLIMGVTAVTAVASIVIFSSYTQPITRGAPDSPLHSVQDNDDQIGSVAPSLAIVHEYHIEYLLNTALTPAMIIADAKIEAPPGTVLTMLDFDQVNPSIAKEYAVHLSVTSADGSTHYPNIALIVAIVETLG